jgi:serine/threonine protein kinase/Tol biopolymer transport system component/tetratricopeptide (TPR) repeat protein
VTGNQWEQVKEILDAALGLPPAERRRFLDTQCAHDPELLAEVLSLLEAHEDAGDFLEPAKPEPAGKRIGAYELVRELGRGGMGAVYLASRADNEFHHQAAIKLIREDLHSPFLISRFRRERQIVAQLDHPNIARLIDGGATSEGHPYFVMEYVEGQPLLEHCQSRGLGTLARLAIFQKVCAAVHYAHCRLIIHRDLKPNNIQVTADGEPKLLDFGIAKTFELDPPNGGADLTQTGFRLATPAYASPEQIRGERATVRSDVYSLGIILFELLAGPRDPNASGPRNFSLTGRITDAPRLKDGLNRIVRKAVRNDPAERYESVAHFSADIERAVAGAAILQEDITTAECDPPPGSIAVLPFQLLGAESASESYLGLGITDALITKLGSIGRIDVRPTGAVTRYGPGTDPMEAGRELRVRFVLDGRLQKANGRVRANVQLIDVAAQSPAWAGAFEEPFEDLLKFEDSISGQVAQAILPQLTGEERERLAQPGTKNPKAHQAYLRGRWFWSRHTEDDLLQALLMFSEAVAADPEYGRAHAGIADYYAGLGVRALMPPAESFAAAIQSAQTAIRLDPQLAEAHATFGFAQWMLNGDTELAAHHLQLAIALNPGYAVAHDWFGLLNSARGETQIALASLNRARKIEPGNAAYVADAVFCHYVSRRYDAAIASCGELPRGVINGAAIPLSLLALGRVDEAGEAAAIFSASVGRAPVSLGVLALAEAASGNPDRARELLDELLEQRRQRYVSGAALALANLACGYRDRAIAEIERACRDRDWWTRWLDAIPVWDDLRNHPKFPSAVCSARPAPAPARLPAPVPKPHWKHAIGVAAVLAALFSLGAYVGFRPAAPSFRNPRISKLTTDGVAEIAAISPDGARVAYAVRRQGRLSLWTRDMASGAVAALAGPFDGLIPYLDFTSSGARLAFEIVPVNDPKGGIVYAVPAKGGAPEVLLSAQSGPVSVSRDESRAAWYRTAPDNTDELVIADLHAGQRGAAHERIVHTLRRPEDFAPFPAPVWSPEGKRLACLVRGPGKDGYAMTISLVDLDGSARPLNSVAWQYVAGMTWRGSDALIVAGAEIHQTFQQIWYVPLNGSEPVRVTNDLDNYVAASAAAGGRDLISVQAQTITNLYLAPHDDPSHAVQITPGGGHYYDLAAAPDGALVYASDATGSADIWTMDANGSSHRQLTNGPGRNYAPAVSPDGRAIAFHSNRSGAWNVWKMDRDGRSQIPLTNDSSDSSYPQFTPDGKTIVYQHLGSDGLWSIWSVPAAGGAPQQLTTKVTMYPTLSPKDGRMASWYCENPRSPAWQIAAYSPRTVSISRLFPFPAGRMPDVQLRFTPRGDALSYIERRNGSSNIWVQPLDGSAPRQVTRLSPAMIYSFAWLPDGGLAYSLGLTTSDVVLLRGGETR